MEKYNEVIQNTTLLSSLSNETIINNLKSGKFKIVSYRENNIIHFEGERCDKLEIILSGGVVVERIDKSGDLLVISEFYSDDIIGGNLIFSKNPYYPMTVSSKLNTLILKIDRDVLFELFCNNSILLANYLEFVSDNASILGIKIKNYVNKTIRESVMSYLNYESKKQKSNHIILNMSKKALAERIGVQRTSLSRELAKMRKDKLIVYDADSITLLK